MTRTELQTKINELKEELENRHKYGKVKLANSDGTPITVKALQEQMYSLIYKLSKME